MDLKVEEQYSYFIYPFYIKQGSYTKFIGDIIEDEKWEFKILNSPEDQKIASFFLPDVRKFLFPTLEWDTDSKEEFKKYAKTKKVNSIISLPKATFEYDIKDPIQSSMTIKDKGKISFFISKIMIITFEKGAGLLIFKTFLDDKEGRSFNKILDFNINFREITLFHEALKSEEASIDCDKFECQKSISQLIKHLLNNFTYVEKESLYYDRLFTYAYVCLNRDEWNNENEFERIMHEFFKLKHVLPGEFYSLYNEDFMKKDDTTYSRWNYTVYGFLKESGVVLGSSSDSFNKNQLPLYFETIYFYIFIMAMYQRMMLLLLSRELAAGGSQKIGQLRAYLLRFTNISWFTQITNSEQGMDIWKKWQKVFELNTLFEEVQREYTEYYEYHFAKGQDRINRFLVYVFVVSVVFPGISLLLQFGILDSANIIVKNAVVATLGISILLYPLVAFKKV